MTHAQRYLSAIPEHLQLRKQPKQKRSIEAFDKILDAAVELSYETGSASVNTNAIAEKAGMDVASVYRTFPNKESILYWAANRWLSKVRSICVLMDGEEFADLSWRVFLAQLGQTIAALPEFQQASLPLQRLWTTFPEFQALVADHYEFLVKFYVRHFKRFGATLADTELEHLAYYLIVSSGSIRELAKSLSLEREQAIHQLDYETWIAHLSKVLPD